MKTIANNPEFLECDFQVGEAVIVKKKNGNPPRTFLGSIRKISVSNAEYVVEDQDGDCFGVDKDQLSYPE